MKRSVFSRAARVTASSLEAKSTKKKYRVASKEVLAGDVQVVPEGADLPKESKCNERESQRWMNELKSVG